MVKAGVAWPSRSLTTLTGTPALMSRVAWVWRVVEADGWDAGSGHDPFERLGDGVWVDGRALGVGEHPAVRVGADGDVLSMLPGSPRGEEGDGGRVEVDAPTSVTGFAS